MGKTAIEASIVGAVATMLGVDEGLEIWPIKKMRLRPPLPQK